MGPSLGCPPKASAKLCIFFYNAMVSGKFISCFFDNFTIGAFRMGVFTVLTFRQRTVLGSDKDYRGDNKHLK